MVFFPGSAIGGKVAAGLGPIGFFASVAGMYVLNQYVFPELAGRRAGKGVALPSGTRLNIQTEGSPGNVCIGPDSRVGGVVTWLGPLKEKTVEINKIKVLEYLIDLAIDVAENQIHKLTEMYAGSRLVFDEDPSVRIVSNQIEADFVVTRVRDALGNLVIDERFLELRAPFLAADLTEFQAGLDITVSGFNNAVNNRTYRVMEVGFIRGEIGKTVVRCLVTSGNDPVDEAAGAVVTLDQDGEQFDEAELSGIEVYNGSMSQTADPTIEEYQGLGRVPGFQGTAYVVVKDFNLTRYGNVIPDFEFRVNESPSATLPYALGKILDRTNVPSYDVSALSGEFKGFTWSGPVAAAEVLGPILMAYDVVAIQREDTLVLRPRTAPDEVAINPDDLGSFEIQSDTPPGAGPPQVDEHDADWSKVPDLLTLTYTTADADLEPGTVRERIETDDEPISTTIDLQPLTLTDQRARDTALRMLWTPRVNRRRLRLTLPPSYLHIEETDVLTFTIDSTAYRATVLTVQEAESGMIVIDAIEEVAATLDYSGFPVGLRERLPGGTLDKRRKLKPLPTLGVWSSAPLSNGAELEKPGFQVAGFTMNDVIPPDMTLYQSRTEAGVFSPVNLTVPLSTGGRTLDKLGAARCTGTIDGKNTVSVEMQQGAELKSASLDDVLNGANMIVIGYEVLSFQTATHIGTTDSGRRRYRLSTLIRGQRGTETWALNHPNPEGVDFGHGAGEQVILLTNHLKRDIPTGYYELQGVELDGTAFYILAPGARTPTEPFLPLHVRLWGGAAKPLSPTQIQASRRGNGDVVFTWDIRDRHPYPVMSTRDQRNPGFPQSDPDDFRLDILTRDWTGIYRTAEITDRRFLVYTRAEQNLDGYGLGQLVKLRIARRGHTRNKNRGLLGWWAYAEV